MPTIKGLTGETYWKSRYIFENHPGAYIKEANKWWDGYREDDPAHKTVLIDDLHPKWSEKERLKNWGDRYPFMAEIKGGSILIRPARILITSNYHPSEVRDRTRQQKQFWRCFLAILRCFLRPTWVQLWGDSRWSTQPSFLLQGQLRLEVKIPNTKLSSIWKVCDLKWSIMCQDLGRSFSIQRTTTALTVDLRRYDQQ